MKTFAWWDAAFAQRDGVSARMETENPAGFIVEDKDEEPRNWKMGMDPMGSMESMNKRKRSAEHSMERGRDRRRCMEVDRWHDSVDEEEELLGRLVDSVLG